MSTFTKMLVVTLALLCMVSTLAQAGAGGASSWECPGRGRERFSTPAPGHSGSATVVVLTVHTSSVHSILARVHSHDGTLRGHTHQDNTPVSTPLHR